MAAREIRRSLTSWAEYALAVFDQKPAAHHRLLIEKLEQVERREISRLMIWMPPGSAKSTYASVLFPAWFMARNPASSVLAASHTSGLADQFSRRVQRLVAEHGDLLGYLPTNNAVELWHTDNLCQYKATGVGGGIAGFRSDICIVDDPVRTRKDADSPTYRETAYNWYKADVFPRLKPNAGVIVIQCMTGETPVMMADRSEKPLRDIRPGDLVSTYRNGKLSVSKVKNWINHGTDRIFEIKMISGKVVRANARHPFLVCVNGEPKWIRLKDLRQGQEIFRVKKENGKEKLASMKGANYPLFAEGIARLITAKKDGLMGYARHLLIPSISELDISNLATASRNPNTMLYAKNKTGFVRFASNRPAKMFAPIGVENSASIIATIQKRFARFSAMIATSLPGTQKHRRLPNDSRNTCDFTLDRIESINPAGSDDVFDIEVSETENFIANGLVSHNTRWHEDDLSGRLIQDDPNGWDVVKLPAFAEEGDPLGRAIGDPLGMDDAYGYDHQLRLARQEMGERDWSSLYMQSPRPISGGIFKVAMLGVAEAIPAHTTLVRAWDLAATAETGGRDPDWTTGGLLGRTPQGGFVMADLVRVRGGPDEVEKTIVATAQRDGRGVEISIPQDPGQAGVAQVQYLTRKLSGHRVHASRETGDKATRAMPFASQMNVGNVSMIRGEWNREAIHEFGSFPGAAHDDIVDCFSRGFERISGAGSALERARLLVR